MSRLSAALPWPPRDTRFMRKWVMAVGTATVLLAGCAGPPPGALGSTPATRGATASSEIPADASRAPSSANSPASSVAATVSTVETEQRTEPRNDVPAAATDTTAEEPAEPLPTASDPGGFRSSISVIDDDLAQRMQTSWHSGCPVPLDALRYLTVTHHTFDGVDAAGELVVAASAADAVVHAFRTLYEDGYPIRSMRLVDDFGGSDDASMAADNTSAFNCRPITGGGGWSEHSYGTAVDVNPVENPYLAGSTVLPAQGRSYVDRPDSPGVIHAGDAPVSAFAAVGFTWGGSWTAQTAQTAPTAPIDYQHFSLSGR